MHSYVPENWLDSYKSHKVCFGQAIPKEQTQDAIKTVPSHCVLDTVVIYYCIYYAMGWNSLYLMDAESFAFFKLLHTYVPVRSAKLWDMNVHIWSELDIS